MPRGSNSSTKARSSSSASSATNTRKRKDTPASAENSPAKKRRVDHESYGSKPGIVLTVGEGDVGQLGLGPDVLERSRVTVVDLPKKCKQVDAGGMHTACLSIDGEVYSFGCNDEGALGRDTSAEDSETQPGKIELAEKVVMISAGDSHTAMLTDGGQLYACGTFRDANGSIGLNPAGTQKTPVLIPCPKRIVKIASGSDHIVALTEEGKVFTVGAAEQGQLGRVAECFTVRGGRKGLGILLTLAEVHFRGSKKSRHPKFVNIWSGTYVTFAKASTGEIYAWGLNNYYQLGFPDMENRFVPELVQSFESDKEWEYIAGGQHHTLACTKSGEVYALGRGTYGQLGLGESETDDVTEPTQVKVEGKGLSVTASSSVSFSVSGNGKAYGWGMGSCHQLSNGSEDDQFEPKPLGGKQLENRSVIQASSGGQHTVLLVSDN